MKITMLGTGTPSPSLKRQSSGYVIEVADDVIIFDHGPGAHHRLLESGYKGTEITHAFFSHLHYDHCLDYPRLVLQRWDTGADLIADLKVFGPPPIKRMTEQLFGDGGVFDPDITARVKHQGSIDIFEARGGKGERKRPAPEVSEMHPGDMIEGNGWRLTVAKSSHVQPYLECNGFRLDSDEGSLCYSGDSGGVCGDIVELAKDVDVLIHMTHYRTGTEPTEIYREVCGNHIDTAEVAKRSGCKTLVLTHILEQIDQPGVREALLREMMAIYDGNIIWGEDMMEIPISGPQMAKME